MAIFVDGKEGECFKKIDPGMYQAVCVCVKDVGTHVVEFQGQSKEQRKVVLAWQVNETRDDGKRHLFCKEYTASIVEKANLRKDLKSWRGRDFTAEELERFDLETVVGVNCMLNIVSKEKDGKDKREIGSISPLVKGMPRIEPTEYELPKWVEEKRLKSIEVVGKENTEAQNSGDDPAYPENDLPF